MTRLCCVRWYDYYESLACGGTTFIPPTPCVYKPVPGSACVNTPCPAVTLHCIWTTYLNHKHFCAETGMQCRENKNRSRLRTHFSLLFRLLSLGCIYYSDSRRFVMLWQQCAKPYISYATGSGHVSYVLLGKSEMWLFSGEIPMRSMR